MPILDNFQLAFTYTVIYDKVREFSKEFKADLAISQFEPVRTVTKELSENILKMSYKEWKEIGYSKGSLWYMKHNINRASFKVYSKELRILGKT